MRKGKFLITFAMLPTFKINNEGVKFKMAKEHNTTVFSYTFSKRVTKTIWSIYTVISLLKKCTSK